MNALPVPAEPTHLAHPKYRADIDGLRAIAVLSVVGFHAFPEQVKGGFIGVDIFFVISGYLISSIIISSLERGVFSFAEFYARRVKRIFPALILVMTACYAMGWFALLPDEYKQLGKHISAGAGFVSNLFFWQEAGYFDHAAQTKPLLHLWSLGIEEQFYIVWPMLLYLTWRRRFNFLWLAIVIAVISFAFGANTSYSDTAQAYYSPASRFWELMTGGILAYLVLHKLSLPDKTVRRMTAASSRFNFIQMPILTLRDKQAAIGALLIGFALLLITRDTVFPGYWALLPALGACLIISAGPHAWLNRTVLAHRVMVWIGLISYPLYLWHWPLLSFARIIENATPSVGLRIAVVIISVALAWLTYRLLEQPVRFGKNSRAKTAALLILMCVIGMTGYETYRRDGLEFRIHNFVKITKTAGEWGYPGNLNTFTFNGRDFRYQQSGREETTLFIGDSNMEQYYPRIEELIKNSPSSTNSIIFSTDDGCAPLPDTMIASYKHCAGLFEAALKLALQRKEISSVVIGGLWYQYLSGAAREGGSLSYFFAGDGQEYPIEMGSAGYQKALTALSDYIKVLNKNNKRVILILNIPTGDELDPFYMVKRSLKHFPHVFEARDGGLNLKVFEEKYGRIKHDLIDVAATNKIELIDPVKYLCSEDRCPSVDTDGEPLYKDGQHLRPYFVKGRATFIDSTVSN